MRRVLPLLVAALIAGCTGTHPWAPTPLRPHAGPMIPADVRSIYRGMGLLADSAGLRCLVSIHYLATASPDSTLVVLGVSMANRALRFVPSHDGFTALYSVELAFRRRGTTLRDVERQESVRVGTIRETLRTDESIVFQEFVAVPPGSYAIDAVVRDRNNPVIASVEAVDSVPAFTSPSLASPIAVYDGTGRTALAQVPTFTLNPRSVLRVGPDSLRFYVEGYGLRPGARLLARVIDSDSDSVELWRDTLATSGDSALARATIVIGPGVLPLGRAELLVAAVGTKAHAAVPFLVGFSERWGVVRFDQMLALLRFFPRQDLVTTLRNAPRDHRAAAWQDFYRASDPNPTTPENEALDQYFGRLSDANDRYNEAGIPGWQTDRGEVFIALGPPNHEFDVPGGQLPGLRWEYDHPRLTLFFRDVTGAGNFRLAPESRAIFEKTAGVSSPIPSAPDTTRAAPDTTRAAPDTTPPTSRWPPKP